MGLLEHLLSRNLDQMKNGFFRRSTKEELNILIDIDIDKGKRTWKTKEGLSRTDKGPKYLMH